MSSYLNETGRKRFEVYICTTLERQYAIEIWRLLDPKSRLINSDELLNRIVCFKSGGRKALYRIFHDGKCHPNMSLIIDNSMSDWNFEDQSRVHSIPAFTPYHCLNLEGVNSDSTLSEARNVVWNVRNKFYREYEDYLLSCMANENYEGDMRDFPPAPDVKSYLINKFSSLEEGELDQSGLDLDTSRRFHRSHSRSKHVSFKENMFQRQSLSTTTKGASHESCHINDEFQRPFGEHCNNPVEILEEIARQSGGDVKYETDFVDNSESRFYVQVWFHGEKIGDCIRKTRKEAQKFAAEEGIHYLACRKNEFPEFAFSHERKCVQAKRFDSYSNPKPKFRGHPTFSNHDHRNISNESHHVPSYAREGCKRPVNSVDALEEICASKGFSLNFRKTIHERGISAQAVIDGQILGEGTGFKWNQAMLIAAEEALGNFRSMIGRFIPNTKNLEFPRSRFGRFTPNTKNSNFPRRKKNKFHGKRWKSYKQEQQSSSRSRC